MHVHYRPAMDVLDRLADVDFVAVVAPTAAGKTSLIKAAINKEPVLHKVLNNTSRAPRPGEHKGVDFRFLPKQAMLDRISKGEYVQVAPTVFGDIYATAPEDYATDGVAVLEVLAAAVPVFRSLPFRSMRTIYIAPPGWEEWQRRVKAHGFTSEQLDKRMAEAKKSLKFALDDKQTGFIVNDDLDQAARDFATLALGKTWPTNLRAAQSQARELVGQIYANLGTHLYS